VSAVKKRSVSLSGHRTSYSIEEPFLEILRQMAADQSISLARLIGDIDAARPRQSNLSSALRLAALDYVRNATLKD
jgi:predicted DNA-binding ribbon-helix-helix protein